MDQIVLRELRRDLGTAFLAYLLAVDEADVVARMDGTGVLDTSQEDVIAELSAAIRQAAEMGLLVGADETSTPLLSGLLGYDAAQQTTHANVIRQRCGGDVPVVPELDDEVANLLSLIARDVYAATLLPWRMPTLPPLIQGGHVLAAVLTHPLGTPFEAAVMRDAALSKLFQSRPNDPGGPSGFVMSNLGSGASIQLGVLASGLIQAAHASVALDDNASAQSLVFAAARNVVLARKLALGREATVRARVGVAGVRIPPDAPIQTPWGVLRAPHEAELAAMRVTPEIRTDAVFEIPVKMRIVVREPSTDPARPDPWDDRVRKVHERLHDGLTKLFVTLFVSLDRERPVAATRSWTIFDQVIPWGGGMSWQAASPFNTPDRVLTEEEVERVRAWADRVSQHYHRAIDIAVERGLAAVARRANPTDALIDAVIALENLFGSPNAAGEVTFRLSISCAMLLEPDNVEARRACRKHVAQIYDERSAIVHGRQAGPTVTASRDAAISILRRSLQALFERRPELIKDRERALELILRG